LPQLESLELSRERGGDAAVTLAPLAEAQSLRSLVIRFAPSAANIIELRALSQLRSLQVKRLSESMASLLAPGHQLGQLQTIDDWGLMLVTAENGPLLTALPQLTTLKLSLDCAHVDFLQQLPALTDVSISGHYKSTVQADGARIVQALHSLPRLRSLMLISTTHNPACQLRFTSEQLAAAVPHWPQLEILRLNSPALDSLRFLTMGSLPRTLTQLDLQDCTPRLPRSELEHVFSLSHLRNLWMSNVFDRPLEKKTEQRLKVAMPTTGVFHRWTKPRA